MTSDVERQLMRLLHGELPEAEASHWRRRLEAETELAALNAELESLWSGLELAEPAPAGADLVAAVWRRLDEQRELTLSELWRLASVGTRAMAVTALMAGIGLGVFAGSGSPTASDESVLEQVELTLAESYWLVIEDEETDAGDGVER